MDRITFDFENNTVEIENSVQSGMLTDMEISSKKSAILEAAGLHTVDLTETVDMVNGLMNGEVSTEEFNAFLEKTLSEE